MLLKSYEKLFLVIDSQFYDFLHGIHEQYIYLSLRSPTQIQSPIDRVIIFRYRNTQAPEENDYYVGLIFYLFQVFPNPLREFIFTDITRRDANNGLILVFR